MAAAGLRLISHLYPFLTFTSLTSSLDLITCLASYSNPEEAWVWPGSEVIAMGLLRKATDSSSAVCQNSFNLIAHSFLKDRVQPLFTRSKNKAVTEQGRKSINAVPGRVSATEQETTDKPWKYQSVHLLTVFHWMIQQLDVWTIVVIVALG